MEKVLDRLGVIFPFEVDCFKDTQLPALSSSGILLLMMTIVFLFFYDANGPVLLLPGSRTAAVGRIFPVLLEAFALALKERPKLKALVVYPSERIKAVLDAALERHPGLSDSITFTKNGKDTQPARAVLMSSGTMSLAVALSGYPGRSYIV